MNTALIISWLIFMTVLLAVIGLNYQKINPKTASLSAGKVIISLREKTGSTFIGYYPESKVSNLEMKLLWAGNPWGLSARSFIGLQFMLLIAGVILGLNLMLFQIPLILSLMFAVLLFFVPNLFLNEKVKKRKKEIERDIPNMVGLLTTSINAGVELIPSLQAISNYLPGPLGDELRKAWTENATGKQFSKALQDMAERTGVDILKSFVQTINTAQERGGDNLSKTLSEFNHTILEFQTRLAEEAAKKIPTKMLLPIFLCIFLPMLVLIMTPVIFTITKVM